MALSLDQLIQHLLASPPEGVPRFPEEWEQIARQGAEIAATYGGDALESYFAYHTVRMLSSEDYTAAEIAELLEKEISVHTVRHWNQHDFKPYFQRDLETLASHGLFPWEYADEAFAIANILAAWTHWSGHLTTTPLKSTVVGPPEQLLPAQRVLADIRYDLHIRGDRSAKSTTFILFPREFSHLLLSLGLLTNAKRNSGQALPSYTAALLAPEHAAYFSHPLPDRETQMDLLRDFLSIGLWLRGKPVDSTKNSKIYFHLVAKKSPRHAAAESLAVWKLFSTVTRYRPEQKIRYDPDQGIFLPYFLIPRDVADGILRASALPDFGISQWR